MKRIAIAICGLILACTATNLRASEKPDTDQPQYSRAQIKKMVREAHTSEQYAVLADYYATRQRMFKRKAAEEMQLWAARNAMVNPVYERWPRPVDSARNLHDYYESEANRAAFLQAKFSHLADEAAER